MTTAAVSYLGPPGSFTHQVAKTRFADEDVRLVPCPTIIDAYTQLDLRQVDRCLIPLENSSAGMIYQTLDLLIDAGFPFERFAVQEELSINVRLLLLAKDKDARIERIYSHFAALSHCRAWLAETLPEAEILPVESTSTAARRAAGESGAAAIASAKAVDEYGLAVIYEDVASDKRNVTQFILIGDRVAPPPEANRTAVVVSLKNETGSLLSWLTPFHRHEINLSRIVSRGIPGQPGEHAFLVVIDGSTDDPRVRDALNEAGVATIATRMLGAYIAREPYDS